jgi:hypothetical protein
MNINLFSKTDLCFKKHTSITIFKFTNYFQNMYFSTNSFHFKLLYPGMILQIQNHLKVQYTIQQQATQNI